jgi:NAD(P)H-dependent flavin oxidoreductase YrpB (nitropropane dioxygenase family)
MMDVDALGPATRRLREQRSNMGSPFSGLGVGVPVLAAPMAGGPGTPALVTAAGRAGSIGFLAAGYKTPLAMAEEIAAVRATGVPFGVNLFAPNPVPVEPGEFRHYAQALQAEAGPYGLDLAGAEPVEDDDAWTGKIDLLLAGPVPVVSFTFGVPAASLIHELRRAGTVTVQTVTSAGAQAPLGYPALHYLTSPLRKAAAAAGDPELVNLWAGAGYRRATEEPAARILARLAEQV